MIRQNLENVIGRIRKAAERAGRNSGSVKIVVVTKEASIDQVREVIEAGATAIGENRVKDALLKSGALKSQITWHMIGHLQSKKAKDAVRLFSVIHSVDSVKLAFVIDKEAGKINKVQDILIEVNVSGEEGKFGIKPEELGGFLQRTRALKNISVRGLMTMAPFTDNPESARPFFRALKALADENGLEGLSMGMTQDFEVAVEEGATMVRIGSAIFKPSN